MTTLHVTAPPGGWAPPWQVVIEIDRKRLRHLAEALRDPLDDAWLLLPDDARQRGKDTLRILTE